MDDILVVGASESQHDKRLKVVLQRLGKAGLKLKREKCEFRKREVEYLGHVISGKGISPAENKSTAIQDAPEPTNSTELKAFLHGTTQLLSEVFAEPQFYSGAFAYLTPEKQTMDMGKQSEASILRSKEEVDGVRVPNALRPEEAGNLEL